MIEKEKKINLGIASIPTDLKIFFKREYLMIAFSWKKILKFCFDNGFVLSGNNRSKESIEKAFEQFFELKKLDCLLLMGLKWNIIFSFV